MGNTTRDLVKLIESIEINSVDVVLGACRRSSF